MIEVAKKINLTSKECDQIKTGLKILEGISNDEESKSKWRNLYNKLDDGVVFVKKRKKVYPENY